MKCADRNGVTETTVLSAEDFSSLLPSLELDPCSSGGRKRKQNVLIKSEPSRRGYVSWTEWNGDNVEVSTTVMEDIFMSAESSFNYRKLLKKESSCWQKGSCYGLDNNLNASKGPTVKHLVPKVLC